MHHSLAGHLGSADLGVAQQVGLVELDDPGGAPRVLGVDPHDGAASVAEAEGIQPLRYIYGWHVIGGARLKPPIQWKSDHVQRLLNTAHEV